MSNEKRMRLSEDLIREMREFIAGAILNNQRIADRLGINYTDQQVLNLVDLLQDATPGALARLTGLTTGGVTLALDRLEKAGFVRRERNPEDRRSVIIRMASERRRQIVAQHQTANQIMAQIFSAYAEKDLALILDFFARTNRARVESYQAGSAVK
jgi:MarR family transcriptional regulator, organic hydroperoxide resistance regulator